MMRKTCDEVIVEVLFIGRKVKHSRRRRRRSKKKRWRGRRMGMRKRRTRRTWHQVEVRKHRWGGTTQRLRLLFKTIADKTSTSGRGCFRCRRIYLLPLGGRWTFHGGSGQVGSLPCVPWNFSHLQINAWLCSAALRSCWWMKSPSCSSSSRAAAATHNVS